MKLLLALLLSQLGQAPNLMVQLHNGLGGARLTENVDELDRDLHNLGVRASGGINVNDAGTVRRETKKAVSVRVVNGNKSLIQHGLYPDRRPADVDQVQPDRARDRAGNTDVEVTSLKILDRTDGMSGISRGQGRDYQSDGTENDTDSAVKDAQKVDTQSGDGNGVANGDGFYSRPLSTQIGILAAIGGVACCAMSAGLLMLCLGRGPFPSRKVNTVYGGIIAVMGLLLLFEALYFSIADVAG